MSMERCVGLSLGPKAWGPSQQLQRNPNAALRHFFGYTLAGAASLELDTRLSCPHKINEHQFLKEHTDSKHRWLVFRLHCT